MGNVSWDAAFIVLAVVAVISVFDLGRFRIPNWLTVPFALVGLGYHFYGSGWSGLGFGILGMLVGFSLLLLPYVLGGFGGGDVKLMAALGAWVGPESVITIFIVSAVILGGVSLVMLLRNPKVRAAAWFNLRLAVSHLWIIRGLVGGEERVEDVVQREDRRQRAVPFGVVLVAGISLLLAFKLMG